MKRALAALLLAALLAGPGGGPLWAEAHRRYEPLTQGDIDAYVYLLPRLSAQAAQNPAEAGRLMAVARTTKGRMVYVTAKVAVAQALAMGAMPQAMLRDKVPLYLQPSAEEIALVGRNLFALKLAQEKAGRQGGDSK